MTNWAAQIEGDLAWREGEIASLKLQVTVANGHPDRQRALLRALWAMLYAHYEGFCKACWDLILDEIAKQNYCRNDLEDCLVKLSLESIFRSLRRDTSTDGLWQFFTRALPLAMRDRASFPVSLETDSNLWPHVSKRNNQLIGIPCPILEAHQMLIRRLVAQRNDIAHGKKLVIQSLAEYQPYEDAAFLVMHELAVAIVEKIETALYLKRGAENSFEI